MPKQYERELYEIAKAKLATIGKKTDAKDCSEFDGPNSLDGKYEMNGIRDVRGKVEKLVVFWSKKILVIDCTLRVHQRQRLDNYSTSRGW